jgi:hypothetical protein
MNMSTFDKDYYIIVLHDDDTIPELTPDVDTVKKPFTYAVLPLGGKPLIFENGALDWQMGRNVTPMDPPPSVLFYGAHLIVHDEIAGKLRDMELPNLAVQAAIYIDHKKKWHENYWFLTFTAEFDCWDREHSDYDPEPISDTDPPMYEVSKYSLNEQLLEKTPLSERLLFQMGGTTVGKKFVHKSIADIFRVEGVDLVLVEDY